MKLRNHAFSAAIVLGMAAVAVPANATTIDFSGQPDGTTVGSLYSSLGVTFTDAATGTCNTGCPAPNVNGNFAFSNSENNSFSAAFSNAQNQITFQGVSFSSTLAQAFNSAGDLVASVIDDEDFPESNTVDVLSGTGITQVVFSYNGGYNGPAITNLTFDGTSAVPEPVTWAMMIGGFGLVGGMMRRAHRKSEEDFTRQVRSLATA